MADNSEPAFPRPSSEAHDSKQGNIFWPCAYEGMSLRDWFAGMALQGLMANKDSLPMYPETRMDAVDRAWAVADAMIAEREATK